MIRMEKKTKKEMADKSWVDILVERIAEQKKPPYVITGGMTTSGPAHMGTVCEFLYPATITQVMKNDGLQVEFHFVGDIFDAFDGLIPELLPYKEAMEKELGRPLSVVTDPFGCHPSLGEHYLTQAEAIMKEMGFRIDVVRANQLYEQGRFDEYAVFFLNNEQQAKEIIARTSMRKIEEMKDWSPIMPVCGNCGRIATTVVVWHDDKSYKYSCSRDVKYTTGCGFSGSNRLSEHKWKLQWRLHWPSWQKLFNTSAEGSGVDHMTVGGSATTAEAIHKEMFKREPPIFYKYGFILVNGKKASKSKGNAISAADVLKLIPPGMLKYKLIESNLEQDKDIVPSGDAMIALYEDVEKISKTEKPEERELQKKRLAFNIAIGKLPWKAPFVDILLNYQIYRDWDKVGKVVNDPEGAKYLSKYIEAWLAAGYAPDRYNFAVKETKIGSMKKEVAYFSSLLKEGMSDVEIHNLIYETAKQQNVPPIEFFKALYTAMIGKDNGPRLGKLIGAIGVAKVKKMLAYAVS